MPSVVCLLNKINQAILNPLILLLFSVGLVVFLWGIFKFILNANDETAREEGKKSMMWGLIGMLIMISVFGIMKLILTTFGISTSVYPLTSAGACS